MCQALCKKIMEFKTVEDKNNKQASPANKNY